MADIKSGALPGPRLKALPTEDRACTDSLDRERLIGIVELLFFAYRDFTGEADAVLDAFGFGRAHHRVLHFVNRQPGLRVADLLDILRITKQSLARVLKQLVDEGYIAPQAGKADRRERRLFLTSQGKALANKLAELQTARVSSALGSAGTGSEQVVREFLSAMISPGSRREWRS